MRLTLRLGWCAQVPPARRAFRLPGAAQLMEEYASRLSRYGPFGLGGRLASKGGALWACDRGPGSRVLSSEQVAELLGRLADAGARSLDVLIGGPDGFQAGELERLAPDLRWSFGPLTLPHELAAVVAAEQLYRAWTILKGAPYHLGH